VLRARASEFITIPETPAPLRHRTGIEQPSQKSRSLRALDLVNFFMADVQTGVGPFVAIYLTSVRHWNPAQAGLIISAQNLANLAAQAPAGALVDSAKRKKWLIAIAAAVVAIGALAIVSVKTVTGEAFAQSFIGIANAIFPPAIAAIALGMVGKAALPRRVGRNEAFNHSGNVTFAIAAGLIGTYAGQQWIFYAAAIVAIATIASALSIRNRDIDNRVARAASPECEVKRVSEVFRDRRILAFAGAVVIFHFANAAMLPLVGELMSRGKDGKAALYMSACITIAQFVMTPIAIATGRLADRFGRKPIFLVAFAVLALRGVLYTFGKSAAWLVAVQSLDGIGAGIFGVLWTLIIADLAQGTGRFNFLQGSIQGAQNLGAFLSNFLAGVIAKNLGFNAAFLGLALIAAVGFIFFAVAMPETRDLVPVTEARQPALY